jgi:hypothetical protein
MAKLRIFGTSSSATSLPAGFSDVVLYIRCDLFADGVDICNEGTRKSFAPFVTLTVRLRSLDPFLANTGTRLNDVSLFMCLCENRS